MLLPPGLGQRGGDEADEHHAHGHPLAGQQRVGIPDDRDEDVEELARGADEGVDERAEGLDGEEDEELKGGEGEGDKVGGRGRIRDRVEKNIDQAQGFLSN